MYFYFMPATPNFMFVPKEALSESSCDKIVWYPGSLCVNIYNLSHHEFHAKPGELQFFSWYQGDYIAFETENWAKKKLHLVTAAIRWYAAYIGCPDLDISLVPPKAQLKIV